MSIFGDAWEGVKDTASDAWDGVEDAADWAWDGVTDAAGWVGDHWKQIAVIGTAIIVGTVVTVLTGGAGAPLLVALAAGGFAGGASADVVSSLLDGERIDPLHVLQAGAVSTAITVGTFGLGKLATPAITKILTPNATRSIANQADNLPGAGAAGTETGATVAGTTEATAARSAPAAAGKALADLDPATLRALEQYGLTPETRLYRVADPKFVDVANGQVAGNPRSIALVQDPYLPPVEHPLSVAGRVTNPEYPPIMIPQTRNASSLGPTLNVSLRDPSAYAKQGFVKLEFTVEDVLANGGRIYRDVGANLNNSYIVSVPGTLPYRTIGAPTGHSLEGLPLPGIGPATEKLETYVRTALNGSASTGYKATTNQGSGGGNGHAPPPPSLGPGILGRVGGTGNGTTSGANP